MLVDERGGERVDRLVRGGRLVEQAVVLERIEHELYRIRLYLQVPLLGKCAQNDATHVRRHGRGVGGHHPEGSGSLCQLFVGTMTPRQPADAARDVQAALAAWDAAAPDATRQLLAILEQALDLLQSPHALDGPRPGRTLSSGVDAVKAWCRAAAAVDAWAAEPFRTHAVWSVARARILAVLSLPPTSATARVRGLLTAMLDVWDRVEGAPSSWASVWWRDAWRDCNDSGAALVVLEVLLSRYGVLHGDARELAATVLGSLARGASHARRRSHVLLALVRATRDDAAWPDLWLAPLVRHLATDEARVVEQLMSHVVQPLLAAEPGVLRRLVDALGAVHAPSMLPVLQVAKSLDQCAVGEGPPPMLVVPHEALSACIVSTSARDAVAALALCVDAKSPAQPLNKAEAALVSQFFRESLQMPSAVARQDSLALFVKLLVRLRTSAPKLSPEERCAGVDDVLLDLYDSAAFALHPGAPYACTILGVSLLRLLVEATGEGMPPMADDAAGPVLQEAMRALHKARTTYPAPPLPRVAPSRAAQLLLLYHAAHSTYDDVCAASGSLLARLAERGDPLWQDAAFWREHVVRPSWARLGSPKAADAQAGVHLLRLYLGAAPASVQPALLEALPRAAAGDEPWARALLLAHLAELERTLDATPSLSAVGAHGVHGYLAALQVLSAHAPGVARPRLWAVIERVWTLASPVLCSAAPEGTGDDEDDGDDGDDDGDDDDDDDDNADGSFVRATSSGATPQQVLSFAWRAIKEAAGLLSTWASATDVRDELEGVNDLFQTWMLSIRHRGAFSTVYPCYFEVARRLCASAPPLRTLPTTWLHALLARIDAEAERLGTTRRSAGLGYAVVALLGAHAPAAQADAASAVMACMDAMLHGAAASEQRMTHALNMTRVLLLDRRVAASMKPFQATALTWAVSSFSSPHWKVRNAAMLLFAAWSTRYFGARAFRGASQRSLDPLLMQHPALGAALVGALELASWHVSAAALSTQGFGSALYAVLLVLAQSDAHPAVRTPAALAAVERCLGSGNAMIRDAAARCYVALLADDARYAVARRLLAAATPADQNTLAGVLALVKLVADATLHDDVVRRPDLWRHGCAVTLAAWVDVVLVAAPAALAPWLGAFWAALCGDGRMDVVQDPMLPWLVPTALRATLAVGVMLPRGAWAHPEVVRHVLPMLPRDAESMREKLGALGVDVAAWQEQLLGCVLDASTTLDVAVPAAGALDVLGLPVTDDAAAQAGAVVAVVLATESVALRDALVPLLGHVYAASARAVVHTIWDALSLPGAPITARLGVAQALQRASARRLGNTSAALITEAALAPLVLRLLGDDDGDVRLAACALVPRPPLGGDAMKALEAVPPGPAACAKWLRRQQLASGSVEPCAVAWPLFAPLSVTTSEAPTALFPEEAANQYRDSVMAVVDAYYDALGTTGDSAELEARAAAALPLDDETTPTTATSYVALLQRALLVRLACVQGVRLPISHSEAVAASARVLRLLVAPGRLAAREAPQIARPLRVA